MWKTIPQTHASLKLGKFSPQLHFRLFLFLTVFAYLALFRLDELGMAQYRRFVRAMDVNKMFRVGISSDFQNQSCYMFALLLQFHLCCWCNIVTSQRQPWTLWKHFCSFCSFWISSSMTKLCGHGWKMLGPSCMILVLYRPLFFHQFSGIHPS